MSDKDYVPLALRYRPNKLSQVIGQEVAVKILKGMFSKNKIPTTILFSGPYGVGKSTLSRIVGRYVNCQDTKGADECEGCPSCKLFKLKQHPDINEINAGDMRGIDNIRELRKVSGLSPRFNKRVYILTECQGLTQDAWRAALLLLEEPPPRTMFILDSNEKQKFPATILSRCFDIELKEISAEALAKYIFKVADKEGKPLPKDACLKIAKAANGHARNAMQLLEQVLLYLASSKDVDAATKDLPTIVQKALGLPPDKLIVAYTRAVLKGDVEGALTMLAHSANTNAAYFMGLVITSIRNHIRFKVAPKKLDGRWFKICSEVKDDLKKWSPKDLIHLLDAHIKGYERMKTYVVPEAESMEHAMFLSILPMLSRKDSD